MTEIKLADARAMARAMRYQALDPVTGMPLHPRPIPPATRARLLSTISLHVTELPQLSDEQWAHVHRRMGFWQGWAPR